jgi:heat shock protein HtpX
MLRVNGLFGHVQRNNAKTVVLLALFLVLLEAMQITIRMLPAAISARMPADLKISGTFNSTVVRAPQRSHDGTVPAAAPQGATPTGSEKAIEDGLSAIWQHFTDRTTFFDHGWYLVLVIGIVYLIVACWWSSLIMRHQTRARPVSRTEAPELYNLVENLSIAIGLPCPRIEIIETPVMNAYATGFMPSSSTIALTRGLIERLGRDELEAVIAHELVHIRDRDVRLMVVAQACVDMVTPSIFRKRLKSSWSRPLIFFLIAVLQMFFLLGTSALYFVIIIGLIFLLGLAARFAISQTREFTADAGAVEITKNPAALIRALKKVASDDQLPLKGYAAQAMMFSSSLKSLFATHPPVSARIAAIRDLTGTPETEAWPLSRTAEPATVPSGRRRVIQGFGGNPAQVLGTPPASNIPTAVRRAPRLQRAVIPVDKGRVPIKQPLRRSAAQVAGDQQPETWVQRWIVSGRIDRITGSVFGVLTLPLRILMVFGALAALYVLTMMLLISQPAIGGPLLLGLTYLLFRTAKRKFGSAAAWVRRALQERPLA